MIFVRWNLASLTALAASAQTLPISKLAHKLMEYMQDHPAKPPKEASSRHRRLDLDGMK